MESSTITSHFTRDSFGSGPIEASSFQPGKHNAFPKYVDAIGDNAWELWFFDGVSELDQSAIVVSMFRSVDGRDKAGFKVQVLAIWPDKSTWSRDMYFPESIITSSSDFANVLGEWRDPTEGASISFQMSERTSSVALTFSNPGLVSGSMVLTARSGDTGLNTAAELGPATHYMRPIGRASVTADLLFDESRRFVMTPGGNNSVHGGFDRVWSQQPWPQIMTESYYLRAEAGPYAMHLMRIISDKVSGEQSHTVARLYQDGHLICAAQRVSHTDNSNPTEDTLVLSKTYGDGLTGAFADKCHGYTVIFSQGGAAGRKWQFDVRHEAIIWNHPTSAPGPRGTGNTGFVETVRGGAEGEEYRGVAVGGQCQLMG